VARPADKAIEWDTSRLNVIRFVTPNFAGREYTWNFTVLTETLNLEAISLLARL
jgi:hypothetical protein